MYMAWKIEFYNENIVTQIKKWPRSILARFIWFLNLLEEVEAEKLNVPNIKKIEDGLFKLSIEEDNNIGCALFCVLEENKKIIILNEFSNLNKKEENHQIELAQVEMQKLHQNNEIL